METKEKEFRLPRQITEKWLEALESGEYNQTKKMLYNSYDNGYCCLGLLGKLCGIDNNALENNPYIQENNFYIEEIENFIKMGYPEELVTTSHWMDKKLPNHLANMNDDGEASFKEIAFWIRENVELYD